MAGNYMGNMTFGVNFKVDTKALDQLDTYFTELGRDIDQFSSKAGKDPVLVKQAQAAKSAYDALYSSMYKAYNIKLGQFDLSKLNAGLREAKTDLASVVNSLTKSGANVNTILTTLGSNKLMIKETNQFLDKMATTFGNTVRWSLTTKVLNTITGAVQKAIYFTKDLDRSLNDIRIVTGKSADEMERFAKQATTAAQALGKTTTDYTKASLLYYQQGLNDKEVAARTSTTLKASNVIGQSTSEVSEQLTAIWNGYKVSAAETEKYIDKVAAVAASTASNLEELSTGMSKVASAANMMGVDIDQLNAQLSTVISVTRQAPETIGAAFKTVYSRMSTIKAGGIDEEDGATLTSYTAKMEQFGISVLDSNGKLRDMGEVIEEIGNKWETFSREAQVGLAQAMGGTRQYSNLTALFENWDKYQAALKTSQNATGTLGKQQEIYMDSVAAHFEELTAEAEKFYETLLDSDALKGFADAMKFIVKQINGLVSGLGGGITALTNFGFQLGSIFSNQLGAYFGKKQNTKVYWEDNRKKLNDERNFVSQMNGGQIPTSKLELGHLITNEGQYNLATSDTVAKNWTDRQKQILDLAPTPSAGIKHPIQSIKNAWDNKGGVLTEQAYNELTTLNEQLTTLEAQRDAYQLIEDEIKAANNGQEASLETALQGLEVYKQTEAELEKISKEIDINQKKLNEFNTAKTAQNFIANKPKDLLDESNKNIASSITKIKQKQDGNIEITSKNNTNFQDATLLKNTQNTYKYYKDLVQQAKTFGTLTTEQDATFTKIEKSLKTGLNPSVQDIEKLLNEIQSIENGIQQKVKETNKSKETEEEIQNRLNEAVSRQKDQEDIKNDTDSGYQLGKNLTERDKNLGTIITATANGPTKEQINNGINQAQGQFTTIIGQQQNLQKSQKVMQKLMGTAQALTGVVGSLNTYMKDGATGADKYEAAFSGVSSVISGAATAAFGPLGGMIAGAATSIIHGVMDLTGAGDAIAEALKSDAERYQDFENQINDITERINKKKDELSQSATLTQNYHKDVKGLQELRQEWEKLLAIRQAGGELSKKEQERYDSILNQIISLNPEIVGGYDAQHNAILTVNDALGETIKKLQEEYDLQVKLGNIKSTEDAAEITKEQIEQAKILELKKQQGEEKKKEAISDLGIGNAKKDIAIDTYRDAMLANVAKQSAESVEIFNDYLKVLQAKTAEEAADALTNFEEKYYKDGALTDSNKKLLKAGVNAADDVLQGAKDRDKFAYYLTEEKDWFDTASATAFEDYISADMIANLKPYSSKYDSQIEELYSNIQKDALNFSNSYLSSNENLEKIEGVPNQIVTALMQSTQATLEEDIKTIVDKAKNNELTVADMETQVNEIYKNATQLLNDSFAKFGTQEQEEYKKLETKLGSLNTNKSLITIKDYEESLENIRESYREQAKKIFGDNEAAIEGYLESTLGANAKADDLLANDPNASLFTANNRDKYRAFLNSDQDYSKYGYDVQSQFEGFRHDVYGESLFKDITPDILNNLNEIKNSSLDGSALDEETFEALNSQLNQYNYHLTEMSTELGILQDQSLYGTQVWYESLQRIETEIKKVREQGLLDDRKDLISTIKINVDDELAQDEINQLINQDYTIMADIELQGTDTFNTAVSELNNMKDVLDIVGEKGVVAAKDIQELISAFPELANSVTIMDDGTLKLTQDQIELIQKRTQVDIAGTVEAREAELKTQLQRIEQEKARIQAQLDLIDSQLNAEGEAQMTRGEFEEKFLEIYSRYEDAKTEVALTSDDDVQLSSWETANAITDYWTQAYADAAKANEEFVKDVIAGNKAILNGTDFSSSYQASNLLKDRKPIPGSGSQMTGSESILEQAKQEVGEEDLTKLQISLRAKLEEEMQKAEKDYALIQGYMLELEALGQEQVKNSKDLGKSTKQNEKQGKDLYDVYHDINKELEHISQLMTILQKKQKLLKDDALLKNLKAQSDEYDKQIDALNEKLAIQRGYQQELQTRQKNALGGKGLAAYGVTFDENGYIQNYAEIAKKLQAAQNSDETVKDYENFINEVKVYEENLKLALDLEGQIYDAIAKRHELQGQAIQTKIEMIMDVSKAEKKYYEFAKKIGSFNVDLIINPDQTSVDATAAKVRTAFMKASAEALPEQTALMDAGNAAIKKLTKQAKKGKGKGIDWNGQHYNPEDIYQLNEDVEALGNSITENAEQIQQAYQESLDAYSNALKELNDWDKRILAKYDMIHGVYDHAEKLTKLWYGEDSLEAQSMLTNLSKDKADNTAEQARQANEQVKKNWEEYQRAVETGNEKLAAEAYDIWADSITNLQKLTEQYAEERKKQLEDEVALAAKIVETQIYGGKSRDEMMNSWELLNKQAEIYLDTINAQFGVTQLENKYLQAINKSVGNSKAQEKLNKIMGEEMKMLKEKDKLTKYDLERAEAKYDLTLKQIALEEARENKTNLRLRRDSQGNYTYQYTANEDDILKAQNDVNIAQNNLYNMDKKQTESLAQQAFEAESEYAQKLAEIRQKFADDDEARKAAEAELYNAYYGENGILTGILAEWEIANKNIGESIDFSLNGQGEGTVLNSFEKLKQNLPGEIAKLSPALDPAIQTIINKWTDEETGVASAYKILGEKTEDFFAQYKTDIETFASDIDQDSTFGKVRATFDETKQKVDEFKLSAEASTTAIGQLNDAGSQFSFDNVINDLTLTSDVFGDGKDSGLIWQINKANKSLIKLADLDKKRDNLNTIYEELLKQKNLLETYKTNFDNARKAMNKFYNKMIDQAKEATKIADGVAEAINKIKDKTVTITTIHVDKYTTSGDKGGSSGDGPKLGNTPQGDNPETTGDNKKGSVHYNIYYHGTPIYSSTYSASAASQLEYLQTKMSKLNDYETDWLKMKEEKSTVTVTNPDIYQVTSNKGSPYESKSYYWDSNKQPEFGDKEIIKLSKLLSLDTGGYTGVWGEEGRLAMLHEKELVLNKVDTENLLKAVDMIRQIDVAAMQSNMIDTYLSALQRTEMGGAFGAEPAVMEQNITINANFPDAKDRDEIKAAFDSLVNLASQRAFTKRY